MPLTHVFEIRMQYPEVSHWGILALHATSARCCYCRDTLAPVSVAAQTRTLAIDE